jgi:hypothetical protein
MKPDPASGFAEVEAEEHLAPLVGFVWKAKVKMGGVPVRVWDHYLDGEGSVTISLLGALPIQEATGPETARSARHRLAIESLWVPSMLVPRSLSDGGPEGAGDRPSAVQWEAIGDDKARATLAIDDEKVDITFHIAPDGHLLEATMDRFGDVGDEPWGLVPYGFAVEEERSFGGYTVPSRLRGGWWYGSDRYDDESATEFELESAEYR